MKTHRVMTALAAGVFLSSCTGAQLLETGLLPKATAEQRVEAERAMAEICEQEAGTRITQRIKGVEGFRLLPNATYGNGLDQEPTDQAVPACSSNCIRHLLDGYDYVEANVTERYRHHFQSGTGMFRYELVERPNELCQTHDVRVKFDDALNRYIREYPEVFKNKCFAAREVKEFESRYGYHGFSLPPRKITTEHSITTSGGRVLDLQTNRTIGISTHLTVWRSGVRNRGLAACGPMIRLPVVDVLEPAGKPVKKVE